MRLLVRYNPCPNVMTLRRGVCGHVPKEASREIVVQVFVRGHAVPLFVDHMLMCARHATRGRAQFARDVTSLANSKVSFHFFLVLCMIKTLITLL